MIGARDCAPFLLLGPVQLCNQFARQVGPHARHASSFTPRTHGGDTFTGWNGCRATTHTVSGNAEIADSASS